MQVIVSIFQFMSLHRFETLIQDLYSNQESCTPERAIFVCGVLYYSFVGCKALAPANEREWAMECKKYAQLCRDNLGILLAGLDLLMPATLENIGALMVGVSHMLILYRCFLLTCCQGILCRGSGETFVVLDIDVNCRRSVPYFRLSQRVHDGKGYRR
jgi:hypothetical protein